MSPVFSRPERSADQLQSIADATLVFHGQLRRGRRASDVELVPSFTSRDQDYLYIQVDGAGDNTQSNGLLVNNVQREAQASTV